MMRSSMAWRGAVTALALSVTTPVIAQDSAEALFKEGVSAAEVGKTDLAYEKLSAAWKIKQTFDIAGNLGVVENALGKHRDAAEHVDFALRNLPASADAGTRDELAILLGDLKKKVATLQITATAGAAIELDGKSVGTAPLANDVFVEPGKHALLAKGPSLQDGALDFEVAAGDSKTVSIELKPVITPKLVDPPDSGRPMWPAYVGFGVAAAGVGAGIAGFVLSAKSRSNSEELVDSIVATDVQCNPEGGQPTLECKEAVSKFRDSQGYQGLGIAGVAVGGAALTFAIIYMVLPNDSGEEAAPKAVVVPWFGPEGGGFAVQRRF